MIKSNKSNNSNKSNPYISVIVPIYNTSRYLKKCIDSLLAQSYKNLDIILIDDGSTDDSAKICDKYSELHSEIRVIHKNNGGIVSARQVGVEMAKGDYIACVDGDDWLAKDYFKRFSDIICEYNPDVVCCCYFEAYQDHKILVKHHNREGYYSRADMEKEIFPILLCDDKGNSFSSNLWAKVFKKEIYQEHQLVSVNVSMGEDDACVKPTIFHSSSLYIINEPLYYYRQNDDSISRSHKVFSWDGPEIRANHLCKHIDMDKFDFRNQLYRSLIFSIFTVTESQFNRNDSIKSIKKDIKMNLARPLYDEAIRNCLFSKSFKGIFRCLLLKYRLILLIKWHNSRR